MVILAATRIGSARDGDTHALCEMEGLRLRVSLIHALAGQVSSLGDWEMSGRIVSASMTFFPKLDKLLVVVRLPSELQFAWLPLSSSPSLPASSTNAFSSLLPTTELAEFPFPAPAPVLCAASHCRVAVFLPAKGMRISEEIRSTNISFVSSPASWTTEHSLFKNYFALDSEMVVETAQSPVDEGAVLLHTVDMVSQLPSISWGEIEWTKNKLRIQYRIPLLCQGACIAMLSGKAIVGCADRLLMVNSFGILRDLPMPGSSRIACLAPLFFAKSENASSVLVGDSEGRLLRCETEGSFRVTEVALVLNDPFDLQPSTALPFDRLHPLSGMESLSKGVLVVVGYNALGSALLCSSTAAERAPALVHLASRLRAVHSLLPASIADDEASPDSAMVVCDQHMAYRLAAGLVLPLERSQTMDLGAAAADARIHCTQGPREVHVVTSRAFRCSAVLFDQETELCGDEETLALVALSDGEKTSHPCLLQVTPQALVVVSKGGREMRRTPLHQLSVKGATGLIRFAAPFGNDTVRLFFDRCALSVKIVRGEPQVAAAVEALPAHISAVASCASIVAYACWGSAQLLLEEHLQGTVRKRLLPLDLGRDGERLVKIVAVQTTDVHLVVVVASGNHVLCYFLDRHTAFQATTSADTVIPQRVVFPAPVQCLLMHPERAEVLVVTCSPSLYLCSLTNAVELRVVALHCGHPGQAWCWAGQNTLCALGMLPGSSLAELLYYTVPPLSINEALPHLRTHSWRAPAEKIVGVAWNREAQTVIAASRSQVHWLQSRDLACLRSRTVTDRIICVPPQIHRGVQSLQGEESEGSGALIVIAHGQGLALQMVPHRSSLPPGNPLPLPAATLPLLCCEARVDSTSVLAVVCGQSLWLVGGMEGAPGVKRLAALPLEDTAIHSAVADGCVMAINRVCGRVLVVRFASRRRNVADPQEYSITTLADLSIELPVLGIHFQGPAPAQPSDCMAVQLIAMQRCESKEVHCLSLQLPEVCDGSASPTEVPATAWTRFRSPSILQSGVAVVSDVRLLAPDSFEEAKRLRTIPVIPLVRLDEAVRTDRSVDSPPRAWRIACSSGERFIVQAS